MSPLTDVRNEITKAIETTEMPKPLYVVAGVGGLAVEKLRDAEKRVRALQIEQRIAGLGDGARALPGKVQTVQADVQGRVRELPATVVNAAMSAGDRATTVYDDLSERGKKLVGELTADRAVTITDAPVQKADTAGKGTAKKTAAKTSGAASKTSGATKNGAATKNGTKSTSTKSGSSKATKSTAAKTAAKKA